MLKDKEKKRFMAGLTLFGVVLAFFYYDGKVKSINATMLAFSYRYGFISRGLLGTIYRWVDSLLPVDMMNYESVKGFSMVWTLLFFALFALFVWKCIRQGSGEGVRGLCGAIVVLTIFTVPTFTHQYNFGRFDMYLCLLTVVAVMLMMDERWEWLTIPIAGICVMIHQGYVFMYFNVILVILFYKWMSSEGQRARKYRTLFFAAFAVGSALFLYFEFFSHVNGEAIVDDVIANAKLLSNKGKYHKDVVSAEILGVDLTKKEWKYHVMNFVHLPIFAVLILPYIRYGVKFFGGMVGAVSARKEKLKYLALAAGGLTLLPLLILKVDYGRWMYALIFYYAVVTIWLLAAGDENAIGRMGELTASLMKNPAGMLLLVYPMLLTPFYDVAINRICSVFAGIPNDLWWHFW